MNNNDEERMLCEMRAKASRDKVSALNQSKEEGIEIGQRKVILKMIEKGKSNEEIIDFTDLTEEVIKELRVSPYYSNIFK